MMFGNGVRRVRVPVKNVDGDWECSFGGKIPVVDGAEADIVIDSDKISDAAFLAAIESKGEHKVLPEGTELLVSLTIKPSHPPSLDLERKLVRYMSIKDKIATSKLDLWNPDTLAFVFVRLATKQDGDTDRPAKADPGLWLLTQGVWTTGISSGPVILPEGIAPRMVSSLNHALTVLSEKYETWRISHTGNVYSRVWYLSRSGKWYPLKMLRDTALQDQEKAIADKLWDEFMRKMSSTGAKNGESA
jgi:hypothetical protein